MNGILPNCFSFLSLAFSDVECFVFCMSFNEIGLIRPFALSCSGDFKPAAGVLARILDSFCLIVVFVSENAESVVIGWINKGNFISVFSDAEFLAILIFELFDLKFLRFRVDTQRLGMVQDRDYFV